MGTFGGKNCVFIKMSTFHNGKNIFHILTKNTHSDKNHFFSQNYPMICPNAEEVHGSAEHALLNIGSCSCHLKCIQQMLLYIYVS